MREIQLTQGKVALVDDEDYADLSQFKWYARRDENRFYAVRNKNYGRDGKRIPEQMHRRILNAQLGEKVDHENHNGLDNRRENIRVCTQSQNMWNRLKQVRKTSSKFKGVCWREDITAWKVSITINRKQMHLGYFQDEDQAACAYDAAARKYFGEFALVNFQ
jgi:hypothetical protein